MTTEVKTIQCKNCEARYKVPATITAHKMACKRCGHPIFLKSRATTKRRTAVRRYTRVKGAVKPTKVSPLLYASGVACLVLLVAVVVYLMAM
jgi:DNA-directed RNA polymerase subunit RPC12/RpoP